MFKNYEGDSVDLSDSSLYPKEWLEIPIQDLFYKAWGEAGRALFYMKYFWPDEKDGSQWHKVDILSRELVGWNGRQRYEEKDRLKLMSWLYRFEDETENQC